MKIATVDIGTNSVLMVIANKLDSGYEIINQFYDIARLGEGVSDTGIINDNAIFRLSSILKSYYDICKQYETERIIAVATSAMRDAKNKDYVINKIFEDTNIKIKIVSGAEEAKLSFSGAVDSSDKSALIDIGGGSTELITGIKSDIDYNISLDVGAVRYTEKFFSSQPPTLCEIKKAKETILNIMQKDIDKTKFQDIKNFYGVAGTVTTIASTLLNTSDDNTELYENYFLTYDNLKIVFKNYIHSTSDEIVNNYKVHPKRADLISMGSLILICIFEYLNIEKIIVSSKGLRFGLINNYEAF